MSMANIKALVVIYEYVNRLYKQKWEEWCIKREKMRLGTLVE